MNEDFGGDFITLIDEDGVEVELEQLDEVELDGETYAVFVSAELNEMDVNDPDYGLIFLKVREEKGEIFYDTVDDDDELDRVYDYYETLLEEEEEEDEE